MAQSTYTHWFDVKEYTSVTVTVQTVDPDVDAEDYTSPMTLIWGQGTGDEPPYDPGLLGLTVGNSLQDEVARDVLPDMSARAVQTKQYDTKARWLMFKSERPSADASAIILSYNFKKAPTELRIRDKDSADAGAGSNAVMRVTDHNARVVLTDASGTPIDVTVDGELGSSTVNSLYVHLADSAGLSIDTVGPTQDQTLAVSIRDASNVAIDSTYPNNGNMTINSTQFIGNNAVGTVIANSTGVEQAATQAVGDAQWAGRALYYVLSDKDGVQYSTTKNDSCKY